MKKLFKTIASGILVGVVIMLIDQTIRYFSGTEIMFDNNFYRTFLYYMLYAVPLSIVNSYFFDYINTDVVWNRYKKYRLAIGFFGSVAITLITIFFIRAFIEMVIEGESYDEFINTERPEFYFSALLITLVISLFFHAVYFYQQLQKNKIKEQKVIAGTASAKFDALKNQLDPHFLFNSLNVLTSLIEEDPHQAQKFTTSLSKVYRYVLEQKNKDLVSVDEELQFAKTYIRLLKMRFEDSIVFEVPESASDPEAKIIPLSLQLLLENAVKHNIVSPNKPLHIKVKEVNNMLVVSNNLQEKQVVKKSSGVGLRNIHQRYNMLTDRKVKINKTASDFSIELPMLKKQIEVMETQKVHLDEKRYAKAKEQVEKIKGFYYNVVSYIFVIPFLIWLNTRTTDFPWAIFPAFGWGFGLVMHGMEAYGYNPILGKNWESRKIKEYMNDDNF